MKKSLLTVVAVLAIVMVGVCMLTACSPASDPDKAEAALKANGYDVFRTNGYVDGVISAILNRDATIDVTLDATKDDDSITIIYYKTAADASAAYNKMESDLEDYEAKGYSGKMVYFGTNAAVKAAR